MLHNLMTGHICSQCVKLGKFDSDRAVTFIPPDGEFVLMKVKFQQIILSTTLNCSHLK
jgi:hypothetical protein